MHEIVCPVAGQAGDFIAEVHITRFLEELDFILGCNFIEHLAQVVVIQNLIFHAFDVTMDAQGRRLPRKQMEVRRILFVHELEKGIDFSHRILLMVARVSG